MLNNMLKVEVVNHFFKNNMYMEVEDEIAIEIYDIVATFTRNVSSALSFDSFFKNIVSKIHDVFYDENNFYYNNWIDRFYYAVISDYDDQRLENMDMLDEYLNFSDKEWLISALLEHEGDYRCAELLYIDNTYNNFIFLDKHDAFIEKEERVLDCLRYDMYCDLSNLEYYNDLYHCVNELWQFIVDYKTGDYKVTKWFNKLKNKYEYYIFDNILNNSKIEFRNVNII